MPLRSTMTIGRYSMNRALVDPPVAAVRKADVDCTVH